MFTSSSQAQSATTVTRQGREDRNMSPSFPKEVSQVESKQKVAIVKGKNLNRYDYNNIDNSNVETKSNKSQSFHNASVITNEKKNKKKGGKRSKTPVK